MFKVMSVLVLSSVLMFGAEFLLDKDNSNVYYVAKKEQFFYTYTILGMNKVLNGKLVREGTLMNGVLKISAKSFITDSNMRDSNVAEILNSESEPFMNFTFKIENSKASGEMKINGVSKNLSFPVAISENSSELKIDGKITIKYTDFGIETPSNLILTAHEELVIGAKLSFKK